MGGIAPLTGIALLCGCVLSGCAADPGAGGGMLFSNAAKVHIYTPEEQANMSTAGTIPTMVAPSELRAYFSNKTPKPTGEVNYCDAGLPALVQARRNEALAAIDEACGGKDQYSIRHEGLGNVKAHYVGSVQLTPSCSRSKVIIFRCSGRQPQPDLRK
ncbi:MAG: hypothetical protein LDL16_06815 [Thiobacillus sp.]|nr:hypothetical protein [Thiobacillus sp.]